mgnify:CR=1 FL=1
MRGGHTTGLTAEPSPALSDGLAEESADGLVVGDADGLDEALDEGTGETSGDAVGEADVEGFGLAGEGDEGDVDGSASGEIASGVSDGDGRAPERLDTDWEAVGDAEASGEGVLDELGDADAVGERDALDDGGAEGFGVALVLSGDGEADSVALAVGEGLGVWLAVGSTSTHCSRFTPDSIGALPTGEGSAATDAGPPDISNAVLRPNAARSRRRAGTPRR